MKRQLSSKLEPKFDKCLFVGYPIETKGYHFYNPSEGKVFVARTRVFLEKDFASKGNNEKKKKMKFKIQDTLMEKHEQGTQNIVIGDPSQVTQEPLRSK